MNSVRQKVISSSGLSKAILEIRKKAVCFKEGKQLFGDDSLYSHTDVTAQSYMKSVVNNAISVPEYPTFAHDCSPISFIL